MLSYAFGQWDDAEKQFQESLVRDPLNTYVLWNLGYTYYAQVDSPNPRPYTESCLRLRQTSDGVAIPLARRCWQRATRKRQLPLWSKLSTKGNG